MCSRTVRRAGREDSRADRIDRRWETFELWRAGPEGEPAGELPARVGSRSGSGGWDLSRTVGGDGSGLDGSAQGWRSLPAVGCGVPDRETWVSIGGCGSGSGVDRAEVGRASAGLLGTDRVAG